MKRARRLISLLTLSIGFFLPNGVASGSGEELALFQAIKQSNCSEIQALLEDGKDVSSRDEIDATPLMRAVESDLPLECVRSLLSAGADPNATHGSLDISVLMVAASYARAEIVSLLLHSGADVRFSTPDNWTALMSAAQNSCKPAVIQALVAAGANIDARDQYGVRPLMRAVQTNPCAEIIETLVRLGADVTIETPEGYSAEELARASGLSEKVLKLLEARPSP